MAGAGDLRMNSTEDINKKWYWPHTLFQKIAEEDQHNAAAKVRHGSPRKGKLQPHILHERGYKTP